MLTKLTIKGFKSIEELVDFELGPLTVLIGANGSGKSNFVDFFRLLRAMADEALQLHVRGSGLADGFLFMGPKVTQEVSAHLEFGKNVYEFELRPTPDGGLVIAEERMQYTGGMGTGALHTVGRGTPESRLRGLRDEKSVVWPESPGVGAHVYRAVSSWTVYHFHDTSTFAPARREHSARDYERFREDASNVAAFLVRLRMEHSEVYTLIRDTVKLVAPFFDDFWLEPETRGPAELIRLAWRQKGSDFPFQPWQLSDGTLRFICLATALLQPTLPDCLLIDEPELGLHPSAIALVADMIRSAAQRGQVIVATQSPILLDQFDPQETVVVHRDNGRSRFGRLAESDLREWLAEYSLGELWQKNVVRAGPDA